MAVVLEQKIGGTTIRIHDDYCKDKTPEDVQKILRRIADFVQGEVVAAELKKLESCKEEDTG